MSCFSAQLTGIEGVCDTSRGGIVKVWIAAFDDVKSITKDQNERVSAITLNSSAEFKPFSFRKNTGSMTSTLSVDATNGTSYVSTDLVLQFTKMEYKKRIEMNALTVSECAIIVKDSNGTYWYLGENEGVAATAGSGQTGQQKTDGNFYTVTLTDESDGYPCEIVVTEVEGETRVGGLKLD